jgi:carboxymethylenebutenolidase
VSEISFERDGDTIRGWLALPSGAGPHPGLILIPDVRGIYQHFHDVARRFACEGFVALVLDLYSREGTPDLPDLDAVFRWMRRLPDRRVLDDIQQAQRWLAARSEVVPSSIGITGFCMGGQYALMAACSVSGLAACVSWYGMLRYAETDAVKPESPLQMAARLACPYLGLFGAEDGLIPLTDVEELRRILVEARKEFTIVTYPGAGHAFFNDARPDMYRADAAREAWAKAIEFLRSHLASRHRTG